MKYLVTDITVDPHIANALTKAGINPETARSVTVTDEYTEVEFYRYNTASDALAGADMGETVVVRLPR